MRFRFIFPEYWDMKYSRYLPSDLVPSELFSKNRSFFILNPHNSKALA